MTQDEIDAEWSHGIAALAVDALLYANIVPKSDFDRAVAIVAEEIYVRLVMQDRPEPTSHRYKSK